MYKYVQENNKITSNRIDKLLVYLDEEDFISIDNNSLSITYRGIIKLASSSFEESYRYKIISNKEKEFLRERLIDFHSSSSTKNRLWIIFMVVSIAISVLGLFLPLDSTFSIDENEIKNQLDTDTVSLIQKSDFFNRKKYR